jgi:hypothetical protein
MLPRYERHISVHMEVGSFKEWMVCSGWSHYELIAGILVASFSSESIYCLDTLRSVDKK